MRNFGVAFGDELKLKKEALQSNAYRNYSLFTIHYSLDAQEHKCS